MEAETTITIRFTDPHHVELLFAGPVTPYMMYGAAGILRSQADYGINQGIRDAERATGPGKIIERVRSIPADIRRGG